ncbi:hypothetical protein P2318_29840 [Myxococcaceae bacterium GXIMD 01537]
MRLEGTVVRQAVAKGSKSERVAVLLATTDGREYVLRRMGGNAFQDPELEALVGKKVACEGLLHGSTFIIERWSDL